MKERAQPDPSLLLRREFFERDPVSCARGLVGCEIVWKGCGGVIVETEAYSVRDDPACHTFSRPSTRAFVAAHTPGTAYVYLNYGVHWLLNFLVKGGEEDGFVLIRALEPTRGLAAMQRRRGAEAPKKLCSGPGKLTQALGIGPAQHGYDFTKEAALRLSRRREVSDVASGPRIGISKAVDLPWRFVLAGSACLSAPL